jgi:hypothetical protein
MQQEIPSGLGILISKKGISYLGMFQHGKPQGKGILFKSDDDGFTKPDKNFPKFESQGAGEKRRPSIRLTSTEGKSKELLLNVNSD